LHADLFVLSMGEGVQSQAQELKNCLFVSRNNCLVLSHTGYACGLIDELALYCVPSTICIVVYFLEEF